MGLWDSIQRERVQVLDVSLVNTNGNKDPYETTHAGKIAFIGRACCSTPLVDGDEF